MSPLTNPGRFIVPRSPVRVDQNPEKSKSQH